VNITPPNSAAVHAHGAAAAQPKNLSLADLLFADSPANTGSDFRAIAATLFGGEGSTQSQSPVKALSNVKKPATGVSEEKIDTPKDKEVSSPTLSDVPAQLLTPPPIVPMPMIQVSAKPDASDDGKLNTNADRGSTQLGLERLPVEAQPKNDAQATNLAPVVLPDDHIPLAAAPKTDTPRVEPPAAGSVAKPLPPNGATWKKDLEAAKAPADRPQPPIIPQSAQPAITQSTQPGAPSPATTDQTKQSIDLNLSVGQEKAPVAINVLPPTTPVKPTPDTSANQVLDSVVASKAVPQSDLANSTVVPGSKSVMGRNASNTSAGTKSRDGKDSRIALAPNGKPGFIQTVQTLGGPNAAGDAKNSPGFSSSDHSGAHGKPVALKQSVGAPSPASLADVDGPDETLPTSDSSPVTAKFVQGMSQSEFRVGMQSQEFGNIDIRTSVARHMFSAQISVEHGDVAKSLTAQLPGLYHRLADQQVAVGNIVIQGQSLGTSSGLAQDAQRQSWQPQGHSGGAGSPNLNTEPVLPVMTDGINSAGRLDIRI
jgi:flagellar hook-length control protein FliK